MNTELSSPAVWRIWEWSDERCDWQQSKPFPTKEEAEAELRRWQQLWPEQLHGDEFVARD